MSTARRNAMDAKTSMGSEPAQSQVRPNFERIALLLQGGGALGSYQAGVYQALAEADLHPHWVAGISIGAINAALIAGNPPERRVERLRVSGKPSHDRRSAFPCFRPRSPATRCTSSSIRA